MQLYAVALVLLVATRDGQLHRLGADASDTVDKTIAGATALTSDPERLAFADGKQLVVRSGKKTRKLPEPVFGVHGLALAGSRLLLLRGNDVVELSTEGGPRFERGKGRAVAATTDALFIARDGEVEQVEPNPPPGSVQPAARGARWRTPGTPLALAAEGDRVYVAMREGQLYMIERSKSAVKPLPLGSWWGTLAMTAVHGKLYVVTQAGKIWEVDPSGTPPAKRLWREGGWAAALAITAAAR